MKVKPLDCRLIKRAKKWGIGEPGEVPGWRCTGYADNKGTPVKPCRRCRAFIDLKNKEKEINNG